MHTNLFPKNRKLHKFATINSNFSESTLSDMHRRKTYMYINFQQTRGSKPLTTVHTNILAKKNYITLQLAIRISKTSHLLNMHYPLTDIQANCEINRPIRYQITAKRIYLHRLTDGQLTETIQTAQRTEGQTSRTTTIVFFLKNKGKTTKNLRIKIITK